MSKIYLFLYRLLKKWPWLWSIFILWGLACILGIAYADHFANPDLANLGWLGLMILLPLVWIILVIGPAAEKAGPKEDVWKYVTCFGYKEDLGAEWPRFNIYQDKAGLAWLFTICYYMLIPLATIILLYQLFCWLF